jgi:hypothetical protein
MCDSNSPLPFHFSRPSSPSREASPDGSGRKPSKKKRARREDTAVAAEKQEGDADEGSGSSAPGGDLIAAVARALLPYVDELLASSPPKNEPPGKQHHTFCFTAPTSPLPSSPLFNVPAHSLLIPFSATPGGLWPIAARHGADEVQRYTYPTPRFVYEEGFGAVTFAADRNGIIEIGCMGD